LLVSVLQTVSLEAVWTAFSRLGVNTLLALVAANGLVLILLTGRWWLLLRAWGFVIPLFTLAGYRLSAFGVSYFTPGPQFGGEPLQVHLVHRHHRVPHSEAVAAVTLDKLLELLVNFAFLVGGALLIIHQQLFSAPVQGVMALFAISLLALPVSALLLLARGSAILSGVLRLAHRVASPLVHPLCGGRWAGRYQPAVRVAQASDQQVTALYRTQPSTLLLALLVSVVSWSTLIGEYWLMLYLLGAELSLPQTLVALTVARLAILFPLPGGLGVLEASQVFAMSTLGLEPAIGLSAALLIRLRDVLLGGAGLWWGGVKS
jgi:uncharacterized protein (TIRG00374 family)